MSKKYFPKIAIFDLDGTLYKGNSHIEILNKYYSTELFSSVLFKCLGRLFPDIQLRIMNVLYDNLPIRFKESFVIDFSDKVINILEEKRRNGFFILILSTAPERLIVNAALVLNVKYHKCLAGKKQNILRNNYSFQYLFVCTDNKSDIDLLNLADECVITASAKHRSFFKKHLQCKNSLFIDI